MNYDRFSERPSQSLKLGHESVFVRVRESSYARVMRLIVGPARPLEVIVPTRVSDVEIAAFLKAKTSWIEEKVAASQAITDRPCLLDLNRPRTVWIAGAAIPVEHNPMGKPIAALRADCLHVGGSDIQAAAALVRWYRRRARTTLEIVVDREAARLKVRYRSISIRDQRTRWGSCSLNRNLSFSWRLILAPSEVLEYVAIHELCHLREPNHSKSFWRTLDAARPEWRTEAAWLREHGHELHRYQPASALVNVGSSKAARKSRSV